MRMYSWAKDPPEQFTNLQDQLSARMTRHGLLWSSWNRTRRCRSCGWASRMICKDESTIRIHFFIVTTHFKIWYYTFVIVRRGEGNWMWRKWFQSWRDDRGSIHLSQDKMRAELERGSSLREVEWLQYSQRKITVGQSGTLNRCATVFRPPIRPLIHVDIPLLFSRVSDWRNYLF